MRIHLEPFEKVITKAIADSSESMSCPSYLIGGYVRDKILHRATKDIDVVCVGNGIELAKMVAMKLSVKGPAIFKRFGTARIQYKGTDIEFVGARKESYRSESRNPTVSPGSLSDDQRRRDFTINTLAISLNPGDYGTLIDVFGGQDDLDKGILRTPLDPQETFSDDPLRMMRAVRFSSQLGFLIEDKTFRGISQNRERIRIVSQERITDELNKIIKSPQPSVGFVNLLESGLIEIIFPEFYNLLGVDTRNGRSHKDNFFHTIEVLDNVAMRSDDLWLRWAAVLHDIAKPRTKRFHIKSGWTFHGHDAVGASMVPDIFKQLRLPLDSKMVYVQKLVRLHLRPISLTKENITDSAIRRLLFEAGEDIDDLMLLCKADITTKNKNKMERYLANYELVMSKMADLEESDRLRNWQPPISGKEVMETFGIGPSRTVGVIKNAIREAILEGDITNDREEAYQFMIKLAEGMGLSPV